MSWGNIRYIEQSFISDSNEIIRQLRNTVLFLSLSEEYGIVPLSYYLDDTQYGYSASAKPGGNAKLLRITDIKDGEVDWNSVPYCECSTPDKYQLKNNDILVARTGGTTGKSFYVQDVPKSSVFASYLIRLRVKKEHNSEFIYTFLNSYTYWSQLIELKRGAAQPNVNAEKLKKIFIPKCSLETQLRYLSILKGNIVDNKLSNRIDYISRLFNNLQFIQLRQTDQLSLLKKLRQQILQDAVLGKLVPQDPDDEPASVLLERIKGEKERLIREKKIKKEKPLPPIKPEEMPFEIPENWVWCRIPDVLFYSNDSIRRGPFGSSITKSMFVPKSSHTTKVYEQKNAIYKDCSIGDYYINLENHPNLKSFLAGSGDIIISCAGTIGETYLLPNNAPVGIINQALLKIRLNESVMSSQYFMIFFQATLKGRVNSDAKGSAMKNLGSVGYLREDLYIPLPPITEQHLIITKVEQLIKLCDELEQSIQQNQKYTQELLQVALKEALEQKRNN